MEKKNTYKVEMIFKPNGYVGYSKVTAASEEEAERMVESQIEPRSWLITGVEMI